MKKIYEELNLEIVVFEKENIETAKAAVGVYLPGDEIVDIDGLL